MFQYLLSVMNSGGYAGIFLAMFAENVFPPIPSEIIMPLAGFRAADGALSLPLVIITGSAGALTGALFWYYVGALIGIERLRRFAGRHGRFLTLTPDEIDRTQQWFTRKGPGAVFFGRMVPGVRSLISIPAGIVRMPLLPFLAYSFAGSAIWTAALTLAGYALQSQYERVAVFVDPASKVIVAAFVIGYLYRVITWKPGPA